MIRIGYIHVFYPDIRCIINKINDKEEVIYKKIKNKDYKTQLYRIKRKLKLTNKNNQNQFIFKPLNKNFDILHTFNTICYTKKPWIVTFETLLPRREETAHYHHEKSEYKITENVKNDIKALADDNCKAIIALSECNKKIQEHFLKNFDENLRERIENKIKVIHPPQRLLLTEKELEGKLNAFNSEIKFLFIGNQFFRKGGVQILNVFNKLRNEGYENIKLIIISNLTPDKEITRTSEKDRDKVISFINRNKNWIEWYQNLENNKVLDIAKKCDVGLLPTIADTYGYSVLEMQAAGLPVITTNIRALPEINNENCGWICQIDKNNFGEAFYSERNSLIKTKNSIEKELEKNIMKILKNLDIIKQKGRYAYNRIKEQHNPQEYANKLYNIYKESIN